MIEAVVPVVVMTTGCASPRAGIPESLAAQIDKDVTFAQILAFPDSYSGRVVLLGGQILKAKRLNEGTRVELLQLPLNGQQEPSLELTQSQGRLLVIHEGFLDPATLVPGSMVTVVGEVKGVTTDKLDDIDYRYPTLTTKHWHLWPPGSPDTRGGRSSIGLFGGMGVGIGGGSRGGGGFGLGY